MEYRDPGATDGAQLRGARDTANSRFTEANFILIGLGVVWGYSVLDALIFGRDFESVELKPGSGGASGFTF